MNVRCFIGAMAFLSAVSSGQAADYSLPFAGTDTHTVSPWECFSLPCPSSITEPWIGTIVLTTDGASVTAFALSSNRGSVNYPALNQHFEGSLLAGVAADAVTSLDGWVRKLDDGALLQWTFEGQSIAYDQPDEHHYGATSAVGALQVSTVPEPGVWATMLAGLLGSMFKAKARARQRAKIDKAKEHG